MRCETTRVSIRPQRRWGWKGDAAYLKVTHQATSGGGRHDERMRGIEGEKETVRRGAGKIKKASRSKPMRAAFRCPKVDSLFGVPLALDRRWMRRDSHEDIRGGMTGSHALRFFVQEATVGILVRLTRGRGGANQAGPLWANEGRLSRAVKVSQPSGRPRTFRCALVEPSLGARARDVRQAR